jgi:nicotinamidase-related amidase
LLNATGRSSAYHQINRERNGVMMIDLENAVLVPIDMQQGFDQAAWPKRWNSKVDEKGLKILAAWRKADRPIIHVQHNSVIAGSTLNPNNKGNAFRNGFEPQEGEGYVSKSVNSAFIGTDLDLRLRRLGAKSVVVYGISTDMCVSTTIRMGANMGWPMIMVEDACDCFEQQDSDGEKISAKQMHEAHVATLRVEFCKVTTAKELLALL